MYIISFPLSPYVPSRITHLLCSQSYTSMRTLQNVAHQRTLRIGELWVSGGTNVGITEWALSAKSRKRFFLPVQATLS